MGKIATIFYVIIAISITKASDTIDLNKEWRLQSSAKINSENKLLSSSGMDISNWYKVDLPKTVLSALVDNKVYPNPYFGTNLKSIPGYKEGRWLSMSKNSPFYSTWWYRKTFEMQNKLKGKRIVLHLDGINYKANIWLNGKLIADSSEVIGMFRRFEFDIDKYLNYGKENILAVEISAPGKIPDMKYHTKQIEATTGWDDHNPQPPDLNMGIWRSVYLTVTDDVTLKNPYVVTDLHLPNLDKAFLTVSIDAVNKRSSTVNGKIRATFDNIKIEKDFKLKAYEKKLITLSPEEFPDLVVKDPKLWWPNPVGEQNLHTINLSAIINNRKSDFKNVRFGIREVSTYINDEGWRGYKVNGKNILIRGGAWMTSDMMLNLTHDRYDALIRYAREANLNALRSEGFSIRETDEFYNLCDEYGILVIQQLFGRNLPDENLAISTIKDMMLRIRNHPSLIHFLGHDETFPTKNLNEAYKELIDKYTPERTYQPHSGAFEIENRFKTGGTRTGTMELWTYATPSHYYTHKDDGAWGFAQSGGIGGIFAPYESVEKMMKKEVLWPITNEPFSFHTVLQGTEYFNLVIKSLNMRYGEPTNIEELLRKGQALNYESARGMYEAYARNKYDALGITTWKYDAAWPAALSWQYVDWFLNVGGAYYGAKKACEPLHVQYSYDDHSIYVVNGYYKIFKDLRVSAKIYNLDLNEVYSNSKIISVNSDWKKEAFKIEFPENLSNTFFLRLNLFDSRNNEISNNFYWLSTIPDIQGAKEEVRTDNGWGILNAKPKSFADFKRLNNIPKVKIVSNYKTAQNENDKLIKIQLKNEGPYLAFQVKLSIISGVDGEQITPVFWDDNYITIFPGEKRKITARVPKYKKGIENLKLKIDGWNIEN